MTLAELLDAAYTSEYIELNNCSAVKAFAKRWKYFLTFDLNDIQLSRQPHYETDPLTGKLIPKFAKPNKDSLKSEYIYLID